jgi:hypothetical protein
VAVLGDSFCDILVGPVKALPAWGAVRIMETAGTSSCYTTWN